MQTYVDDTLASTAIITSVSVVFLLLILGLCVISVGLHRAGIIPVWLALLMPFGIIGVISFLECPPPLIGSALLLLVSCGTVGGAAAAGAGRDGSTSGGPEPIGSI